MNAAALVLVATATLAAPPLELDVEEAYFPERASTPDDTACSIEPSAPRIVAPPPPVLAPVAPPEEESGAGVWLAGLVLAGLGAAAMTLSKRRAQQARALTLVDHLGIGPKRSILVVRVGSEEMILGSSEAGIALLGSRPAPVNAMANAPASTVGDVTAAPSAASPGMLSPEAVFGALPRLDVGGAMDKLRGAVVPFGRKPAENDFAALLGETLEDQELRRKLAAGQGGRVS